ncbi:MAG: guanylate kinase [Pirellulaceae bacterium]|jgi:guanylate kinase|nr:guanylate kinase [Pirellulaceae bacterium]
MSAEVGKLVILSGPSGAGKSTVVQRLLADCPLPLQRSVSATTRRPRPGEQNGVHYYFLSHDEFARLRAEDAFLECKEVFGRGDWYGTLRSEVATGQQAGKWVLLEIDVEGARAVVDQVPDAVTIFLHPGSWEELERRLRARGTETDESYRRRLDVAQAEMRCRARYQYEVINDTVERAVAEICAILRRCGE